MVHRAILLLVAVLLLPGCQKQSRMIALPEGKLFLTCLGKGAPAIVFEAGGSRTSQDWKQVMKPLSKTFRVCAYDRFGLGKSDKLRQPKKSALEEATTLHRLLQRAKEQAPYVVVGHSNGGFIARLFAATYPQAVRGVVLVDSGHEGHAKEFYQLRDAYYRRTKGKQPDKYAAWWKRVGKPGKLPMWWVQTAKALREKPIANTVPLVVIAAGKPQQDTLIPKDVRQLDVKLKKKLACLSQKGKYWVAEESHHMVNLQQPEIVVKAVQYVVQQGRK